MSDRPLSSDAARDQEAELRAMLAQVYLPEGVEIWLAHAAKQGWTMEYQLQRAEQLVTGAFS